MGIKEELINLVDGRKWKEALAVSDAIDLDSCTDPEVLLACGRTYKHSYRLNDAYAALSRAFSMNPDHWETVKEFTEVAIETCRFMEGQRGVDKALELRPESFDTLCLAYELAKNSGDSIEKRIDLLKRIKAVEYDENYAYELAELYWKTGKDDLCKSECRRLINYFRNGESVNKAKELLQAVNEGRKPAAEPEEEPNCPKLGGLREMIASKIGKFNAGSREKKNKESKEKITGQQEKREEEPKAHTVLKKQHQEKRKEEKIELPPEIAAEFDRFVGMESVKKHILSFINEARLDKEREEKLGIESSLARGYNFMLVGNPGTGKTTVARVIARTLFLLGIREKDMLIEVDKSGLVGQYIGHTEEKVRGLIKQAYGGTLFIDEAYTLYKKDDEKDFGKEALNILMKAMEDQRDHFSVILAGYKDKMYEMLEANPGLKSRINFIIEIPDYTDEELLKIADKMAEDMGFVITASGKKAILERINRERVDEKFSNARFIRDLLNEAYRNLANRLQGKKATRDELMKFEAEDFGVSFDKTPDEIINDALAELKSLTGLNEVKAQVESIVNSMRVKQEMLKRGIIQANTGYGTLHMVFKGNPGTGKTTVARIIGKIYRALGILKRGDVFVECSRADLVGQYLGHTAKLTQEVVKSALGGILFIDEAYSLYQGENDTFGKEAIDTLIAEMENMRDRLMVILAGYSDDMDRLLEVNPGLKSRISSVVNFEDYSIDEMVQIFAGMVKKNNMEIEPEALIKARELIREKSMQKDFGNARGVRNILENIIRNQNNRLAAEMAKGRNLRERDFLTITAEDIY